MDENYFIECDLVGESYSNPDGSSRQDEISLCKRGDRVALVPEPDNPHDDNAVSVKSERGVIIGYIGSEECAEIVEIIEEERLVSAHIERIHGGSEDRPLRGVVLSLECENDEFDKQYFSS